MIVPFYKSEDKDFTLLKGDCVELLNSFDFKFNMIFADPPYHLSNGGISVQSGRMVSVNKGDWDKSNGYEADYQFDKSWIAACREKLKSDGTIWISGTYHNIFSVARCLTELGFKILNCITWERQIRHQISPADILHIQLNTFFGPARKRKSLITSTTN